MTDHHTLQMSSNDRKVACVRQTFYVVGFAVEADVLRKCFLTEQQHRHIAVYPVVIYSVFYHRLSLQLSQVHICSNRSFFYTIRFCFPRSNSAIIFNIKSIFYKLLLKNQIP